MKQEDKNLLLKYLCARLPYGVYVQEEDKSSEPITEGVVGDYLRDNRCVDYDADDLLNEIADDCVVVKPYLRPMSSMTEEEKEEYWDIINVKSPEMPVGEIPSIETIAQCSVIVLDWLLSKGFDIRDLIPKGLALEAPKDMYNIN